MLMETLALAGALVLVPAVALADEEISASPPNRYTTPAPSIDQGERLTFRNNDLVGHDVTAKLNGPDGKPLFSTPIVERGQTAFVDGSQYLTTGTYDFFCTVHPDMGGALTVTAAGTPQERPGGGGGGGGGGGPAADTTAPKVNLSVGTTKARTLRRLRRLTLTVVSDEAAELTVTAKLGSVSAASTTVDLAEAGDRRVTLKLGARARRALRRGRRLVVTATAKDAAGNVGETTLTKKLR